MNLFRGQGPGSRALEDDKDPGAKGEGNILARRGQACILVFMHEAYLIRRLEDGTMRTVQAGSPRGAMRLFAAKYGPPEGELFAVKLREGGGEWEVFRVSRGSLRSMGVASSVDLRG